MIGRDGMNKCDEWEDVADEFMSESSKEENEKGFCACSHPILHHFLSSAKNPPTSGCVNPRELSLGCICIKKKMIIPALEKERKKTPEKARPRKNKKTRKRVAKN